MSSKINRDRAKTAKNQELKHPLVELFNKHANIITIGFTAVLAVFIAFTILKTIRSNKEMEATTIYDQAMITFQQIQYIEDQAEQQKYLSAQYQSLDAMIKSHPKTLAATRARLFFGQAYYQQGNQTGNMEVLKQAQDMYLNVLANNKNDFYNTVAQIGLAQTYEQLQNYPQAFLEYEKVSKDYKDQGFTPIALVGMARCKEMLGDTASAKTLYAQVSENYPDSQWSQYARGKVYFYSEAGIQKSAPSPAMPVAPQDQLILPQ